MATVATETSEQTIAKAELMQILADSGVAPEMRERCAEALLSHISRFQLYRGATKGRISRRSKLDKIEAARHALKKARTLLADPTVKMHLESIAYHRLAQDNPCELEAHLKEAESRFSIRKSAVDSLIEDLNFSERQISRRAENADEALSSRGRNASRPDIRYLAQYMILEIARGLRQPIGDVTLSDNSTYVVIAAKIYELVGEYDSSQGNISSITKRLRAALKGLTDMRAARS
jgi:hypothetical protein